jgi:hypothetical protein
LGEKSEKTNGENLECKLHFESAIAYLRDHEYTILRLKNQPHELDPIRDDWKRARNADRERASLSLIKLDPIHKTPKISRYNTEN